MPPKRPWCTVCATWLGPWRATLVVAAVDGKAHAVVTGHPGEVWDTDGRLAERFYGEPSLPLWGPVRTTRTGPAGPMDSSA